MPKPNTTTPVPHGTTGHVYNIHKCKACCSEYNAAYRKANADAIKEQKRLAYASTHVLVTPLTESERFAKYVDKSTTPDGCWTWTGSLVNDGYGEFGVGKLEDNNVRLIKSHRYALEQALGRRLKPGFCALHACDNRACVRTDDSGLYEVNGVSLER